MPPRSAMASANAQLGVAEAAWFPSLTLSGSYAFDPCTRGLINERKKTY